MLRSATTYSARSSAFIKSSAVALRMASTNKDQASLTGGHVQYVKGLAEVRRVALLTDSRGSTSCQTSMPSCSVCGTRLQETIGNVTGSKDWQQSGQQDKQAAVDEMRSASSDRKEAQEERAKEGGGWVAKEGAVEAAAGKLSGCQGMQQEGEMKKHGGSH